MDNEELKNALAGYPQAEAREYKPRQATEGWQEFLKRQAPDALSGLMMALLAIPSRSGAMRANDYVTAQRLDRLANKLAFERPNADPAGATMGFDPGVTGGAWRGVPSRLSAGGLAEQPSVTADPFRTGIAKDEVRFWAKQRPANVGFSDLELIPGGKLE